MDGRTEEVIAFAESVAPGNADPDSDRRWDVAEGAADFTVDRLGPRDGSADAREREHGPVPLRLDHGSAVCHRRLLDDGVVASKDVEPHVIADAAKQNR